MNSFKLGNALSMLGCMAILARSTGASLWHPFFAPHAPLFEGRPDVLGDLGEAEQAEIGRFMKVHHLWSKGFRTEIADLPCAAQDSYFRYQELAPEALMVTRAAPYFVPLEYLDVDRLLAYRWVFFDQPYQMTYQRPRADIAWLRTHFQLSRAFLEPEAERHRQAAMPGRQLVGVHLRLGDYKTWRDGRYYFEPRAVAKVVGGLHTLSGGAYAYRIFSSEPQPEAAVRPFAQLPEGSVSHHQGSAMADFAALSLCDVILGPPSSFAHWAAFLGGRRRVVIASPLYQRPSLTPLFMEGLKPVSWPFSIGLENDFWLPE